MKKQLTASEYIETVYGTARFARTLVVDDAQSIMDLMQDFSDHNVKASEATDLLDDFAKAAMQPLTRIWGDSIQHAPKIARDAYTIAEYMMQERERRIK